MTEEDSAGLGPSGPEPLSAVSSPVPHIDSEAKQLINALSRTLLLRPGLRSHSGSEATQAAGISTWS